MNCEYVCPKLKIDRKEIDRAQIAFRNGDFFEVSGKEIVEINVSFYDDLIAAEHGFCPVVSGGFIKLEISPKKPEYARELLCERGKYNKDRKKYIENRCVKEGGICCIRLFDALNWSHSLYGDVIAFMEDEYLIFEFQENKTYGSADKEYHTVKARQITKDAIEKMELSFENCDWMEIFPEEILDMRICLKDELCWNSGSFSRVVRCGYIHLKLDDEITWRRVSIYCGGKKPTVKNMQRRLCGKGKDDLDICRIYPAYHKQCYGGKQEELIEVRDARPEKELERLYDEEDCDSFVGGYARKKADGSILIVFGKVLE